MWQYSFYIVTSWLRLSWLAQFLEKHVTGIKSLWMLMCSSFEPQRILILFPSSTNSCTVFSYLTEWNQIAWHDWLNVNIAIWFWTAYFLWKFNKPDIRLSAARVRVSVQAPRNLFLNNCIRGIVKIIYYLIKKINRLYNPLEHLQWLV